MGRDRLDNSAIEAGLAGRRMCLADLEAVEGIRKAVARKIYDHTHGAARGREEASGGAMAPDRCFGSSVDG